MTKPRETKYARELASAKLPSGPGGKSSVAIERPHWSRRAPGSGQLHEITPNGARLLGEGFV